MADLLTLDQAAALWKSLKTKHPRIPAMPAQSLRVHARSGTLAGEVVDGALYIRKESLLKMLKEWGAPWGVVAADLEAMPAPEPVALKETKHNGTRAKGHGDQKSESRRATPIQTLSDLGITRDQSSKWQAEILTELRAIRELLAKALSGTTAAGV
jgi:hypothetical protein